MSWKNNFKNFYGSIASDISVIGITPSDKMISKEAIHISYGRLVNMKHFSCAFIMRF